MKIYSKYHDYYDTARCYTYCSDSEAIFVRKEEFFKIDSIKLKIENREIAFNWRMIDLYLNIDGKYDKFIVYLKIIGFCGKLYAAFKYNGKYYYSFDDFYSFLEKKESKTIDAWIKESNRLKKDLIVEAKRNFSQVSKSIEENKELASLFEKFSIPYFTIVFDGKEWNVNANCILSELEFYKVVPPNIAYQELEMYFNSVLVKDKPIPVQITDDVVKLEAKGFDKKISFRHRK